MKSIPSNLSQQFKAKCFTQHNNCYLQTYISKQIYNKVLGEKKNVKKKKKATEDYSSSSRISTSSCNFCTILSSNCLAFPVTDSANHAEIIFIKWKSNQQICMISNCIYNDSTWRTSILKKGKARIVILFLFYVQTLVHHLFYT